MEIVPGLAATAEVTVTDGDTAPAAASGDVPVLSTPRLVALCEEASCRALEGHLESGTTSVGARIEVDHIAPTAPGDTVVARAEVERVEGRRIVFSISVHDTHGAVATGKVTRALVNRESFLSRLA